MNDASINLRIPSLRDRVTEAEWQARVTLAAAYRLCDHFGMTDMIATHCARAAVRRGHRIVAAEG
jgi:hypothetical protein